MPSLKQLKYFCILAKNNNMSSIANELFVSQTALSNSISRLEEELDTQLFDRFGRNLVLNKYGSLYLGYAETVFLALENANAAIQDLKNKGTNNVSIALNSPILYGDILAGFMEKHPDFSITQKECNLDNIMRNLPMLDVDLVFAGDKDLTSPYLEKIVVVKDRVLLYVPPNHRFANRSTISLIETKNEQFIAQPTDTGFSRFADELYKMAGFAPRKIAECDYEMRKFMFRQNLGIVLASEAIRRVNYYDYGSCILVDDPPETRDMSIFWVKGRTLSPAAALLRDCFCNFYKNNNSKYEKSLMLVMQGEQSTQCK